MARLIANPAAKWLYSSEPEASTNGRRLPVPRGKLLGGSSSINGMVFVRGQAQDFDTWAQMRNRGWSYTEVLPFFRMESYAGGGDDGFRGREGPLRVTNPEPRDPLFAAIIKAAAQVGIRHNSDYNGASQAGIAMSQATIAGGRRMSTAHCYLDPVRNRRNLHIETQALTGAGARRKALRRRPLFRCRRGTRGSGGSRGRGQRWRVQLAAIAGAIRYRPTRTPAQFRHRGVAARRRREPARPLRSAHPLSGRQKSITFNDRGRGLGLAHGDALRAIAAGACWR
jgi:choline dehydrogenase